MTTETGKALAQLRNHKSPARAARTALFEALAAEPEVLLAALCDEITEGLGFAGFAAREGIRYGDLRRWVWSDAKRVEAVELAEQARAAYNAEAAEAVGRKLIAPDVRTGVEWVDDGPPELDPKAARVAVEAFRYGAMTKDRGRFGKSVQHHHLHSVREDHLRALKAVVSAGGRARDVITGSLSPAQSAANMEPVDAEYTEYRQVQRTQPIEPLHLPLRLPVRPVLDCIEG